jgi:chromosome segregation ATPase
MVPELLISNFHLVVLMPSPIPEEKKREIISRWLKDDSKETISSATGLNAIAVTSVINEWKREIGSAVVEAYKCLGTEMISKDSSSADILEGIKLMQILKRLEVASETYENFLDDFNKFCISTGASPEALVNVARQVLELAKLEDITIYQAPSHVQSLLSHKNELQKEIEDVQEKKSALEQELLLQEQNYNRIKESFAELVTVKDQLSQHSLSPSDISSLADLISSVRSRGYDAAAAVDLISKLESLEQERSRMEGQINEMRVSEDALKASIQQLEQKLSEQRTRLESLEKVRRLGFDFQEFESIHDMVNRIARLQGTDPSSARHRLLQDMDQYYRNEIDFGKRLHEIEDSLNSKQEEFGALLKKYQDKKDITDLVERLASKGVSEQVLLKYQIISEIFKIDLDSLAEDLSRYSDLSSSIKGLEENKLRLEREELLLRHKLVALEDQQHRLASLINDLMAKPGKESL